MFHQHHWQDESVTFTPPYQDEFSVKRSSESFGRDILFGFTTIVQRCTKCNDIKTVKFNGRK